MTHQGLVLVEEGKVFSFEEGLEIMAHIEQKSRRRSKRKQPKMPKNHV